MAKEKACKHCRAVYTGTKCTACGANEAVDTFKGKIFVLNPEESEIAKNLKFDKKGEFALRVN